MRVYHCLVIRSGFEPETHSLEGCCSIQLSYQTSSECACRMNDALSASLGRPRFLLLIQTREVWVSLRLSRDASALTSKPRASRYFFAVTTHEITYAGTQNSAYKGNLGRKGTAFLGVMQIILQKSAKLLQFSYKSSSNSFCKSGLRIAPTWR